MDEIQHLVVLSTISSLSLSLSHSLVCSAYRHAYDHPPSCRGRAIESIEPRARAYLLLLLLGMTLPYSSLTIRSDADLDSLASFSTLASHTTLASIVGRPISPTPSRGSFSQYPGIESVSSSFTDSLGPAWGGVSGGGGGGGSAGRARRPSASPAPSSRLADRDAPAVSVGIQPPSPSSVRSQPHTPTLNPSRLSTNTPQIGLPPKKRRDPAERDEKRRKRERNAERWRRVRAREAAHDAPVRRWTKAAYSRYGTNGAMAAAVGGTLALRVMLTLTSLCEFRRGDY